MRHEDGVDGDCSNSAKGFSKTVFFITISLDLWQWQRQSWYRHMVCRSWDAFWRWKYWQLFPYLWPHGQTQCVYCPTTRLVQPWWRIGFRWYWDHRWPCSWCRVDRASIWDGIHLQIRLPIKIRLEINIFCRYKTYNVLKKWVKIKIHEVV